MSKDKILIVGALGQIGTELTLALRKMYGDSCVMATDIVEPRNLKNEVGWYEHLNILDKDRLRYLVEKHKITQVYLLAAILSAKGEQNPGFAWRLNMESLANVLNVSVEKNIRKIFWPSSIAVFGPNTPRQNTPQTTVADPLTVYGISKLAGERWAEYYHLTKGVDIRSLRYPGLISYKALPGGGTTDYAVDIFHQALEHKKYTCFLNEGTYLPMMYMPDAIRSTLELMEADSDKIKIRSSYNLSGMSFEPGELAREIQKHIPEFVMDYKADFRQGIADNWPQSIDDSQATQDWGWKPEYDLARMTEDMIYNLSKTKLPQVV